MDRAEKIARELNRHHQHEYRVRQKELGRTRVSFYLSESDAERVKRYIKRLQKEQTK